MQILCLLVLFFAFGSGSRLVMFASYYHSSLYCYVKVNALQNWLLKNGCRRSLGLTLKLTVFRRQAVGDSLVGPTCSLPFFYGNVVQLTTSLVVVAGGRLFVNFFPPTATSDVAGPPRTRVFLIEVGVIRAEW